MNPTLFPPNSSLFLGDLSKFCSEADLEKLFGQFGEINQIRIMRNTNTGKALSYGFISFMSNECAASAMEKLNGFSLHGRSMRIGWAAHNLKTHKTEEPAIINSVYVRFITPQTVEYVTEEVIHRAFDQFGSVVDVSIKQSAVDQRSGRQSGYGFVHFSADHAGIVAAFDALSNMNNNTYDGVTYSVEPSKNLLRQMNELNLGMGSGGQVGPLSQSPPQSQAMSGGGAQQAQGVYIKSKNMPLPGQGRGAESQFRPSTGGREDQLNRLYGQTPSHVPHGQHHHQGLPVGGYGRTPLPHQTHNHSQVYGPGPGQGMQSSPTASANAARYGSTSTNPGYGAPSAQFSSQYDNSSYRYPAQQQHQQQHSQHHSQTYGAPQGLQMGGGVYAQEEFYDRPRGYTQGPSHPTAHHGQVHGQAAVGAAPAPVPRGQHSRNASLDSFDFQTALPPLPPPVVTEGYTSSYVIEKPFDERYEPAAGLYNHNAPVGSGSLSPGSVAGDSNSRSSHSSRTFSFGGSSSPIGYEKQHHSSVDGVASMQTAPSANPAYTTSGLGGAGGGGSSEHRRGMSGNSHSFFSHLPGAPPTRPVPQAPLQVQQHHQQQHYSSRRPPGVTDLDLNGNRSHSMSSSGLPTYGTATTDADAGFFKSCNSSFTEGYLGGGGGGDNMSPHHHQFAHLNSFNEHGAAGRSDTWTGISDQQSLLNRNTISGPERDAEAKRHRLLSASMRKLSMVSVTTAGDDAVDDFIDDEDFTYTPTNTSTHTNTNTAINSHNSSLFNFSDAAASFSGTNTGTMASSAYRVSPKNASVGLALEPGYVHHPLQQHLQGQRSSEVDDLYHADDAMYALTTQTKQQLTLSSSPSCTDHNGAGVVSEGASKTTQKSRQLPVTHFFKPVSAM